MSCLVLQTANQNYASTLGVRSQTLWYQEAWSGHSGMSFKNILSFKWYIHFRVRSHDPKGDTFDQGISANMCSKLLFLNLIPFIYLIFIIINFYIITHISFHWLSHPFITVILASNSLFFFYSFFFWCFVKGELAWMQPCDPDMQLSTFILFFF